jgi:hypothetical protein
MYEDASCQKHIDGHVTLKTAGATYCVAASECDSAQSDLLK